MAIYDVYVFCDQCGQPHSVHVKLTLADDGLDKTRLAELYAEKSLPSEIVFMQTNKYRCPHTKQLFPADDIENAVLFISA
ncbi:MAG: hypothetical protein ABJB40_04245 [Acidobacteriota bacterium]